MVLISEIPDRPAPKTKTTVQFKDEPLAAKNSGKVLIAPMVFFHATLCALVRYQYGQQVGVWIVLKESWIAVPIYWALFEYVHPLLVTTIGQILVSVCTITGACYAIYIANELGYYAVMYQAPPVGSLVIWGFIELNLLFSAVVLFSIAGFLWATGYGL